MLPDWLKTKLLAISSQDMSFIVFSLIITVITFGFVMLLILFNHAFRDKEGNVPIKISKIWVVLFSCPIVNLFILVVSIGILVHILVSHGSDWIKGKFE